jgi:hypothetical protein
MNLNIVFRIILLTFFSFPAFYLAGQSSLESRLEGKQTLAEIMEVVDAYYAEFPEKAEGEFESEYLHWKRWEWYMSSRLGHGGKFVNVPELLMDGIREKERMETPDERNINSGWTFMGPSTVPLQNPNALYNGIGRVDRITFHPTNANIIFIGTPAGGLWSTLNGGSSWNNLTDNLPSLGISGFVISYDNTSVMYLLTGDGDSKGTGLVDLGLARPSIGILKSTDGGVSWHQTGALPDAPEGYAGYRLVQSPTNPDILLAATTAGLYRTTNGGTTWVKEVSGIFYDVKFKPGDGTRVYASVKGDFYLSTDSGNTWTSNSTYDVNPNTCGPNGGGRIQIAVAPTNVSKVYLLAGPVTSAGNFCGVWLSTDSGLTFTRQSSTPNVFGTTDSGGDADDQSSYDIAMACRTDLSTSIIVGGCTVWRSTNGGATWTHSTSYGEDGNYPYIHPDIHDLVYNPLNHWVYCANDGGFYRSQDHGVTWTDFSPNIETSQFYHMAGWDGDQYKLMGGLQDNGIKYRLNNSSAFYHLGGGDGFDVVFDPVTGEPGYGTVNWGIRKYSSNGQSSTSVTPSGLSHFFMPVAIHNTDPDIVLLGAYDIFRTIDGAVMWTNEGASGSWALTSCPSNNTRFYAAGGATYSNGAGGLYFSSNTGDTWTIKSTNPGFPAGDDWIRITDVVVSPLNSNFVWACFGGFDAGIKVVASTNTGDTWTNISANLPNVPIYSLAVDNNYGIYAGTDIGVFYRSSSMTQWMPWSNGIPNVPVTDLVIFDDGVTKKIRAATFGRGVWQSDLATTCDAAVVVAGGLEGIRHYEASNSISSSSIVQGGIGTFVSFQSGNYLTLTEGFRVIDESEFLGFISPCGQGGIPSLQNGNNESRSNPNESVILLRRMWDPDDGLTYGSIHSVDAKNNQAIIQFSTKKPGNVWIVAARQVQDKLVTLYFGEKPSGRHSMDVDISTLPDEFHYILFFYDGKLAHFQELIRD